MHFIIQFSRTVWLWPIILLAWRKRSEIHSFSVRKTRYNHENHIDLNFIQIFIEHVKFVLDFQSTHQCQNRSHYYIVLIVSQWFKWIILAMRELPRLYFDDYYKWNMRRYKLSLFKKTWVYIYLYTRKWMKNDTVVEHSSLIAC